MYSLHDITSVCPKLESVDSDEGECNEEGPVNYSDSQAKTFTENFPMNNNTIHVKVSEYNTTANDDMSFHQRTTRDMGPNDNISISQSNVMVPEQTTVNNTSRSHTGTSMEIPEIQIRNSYTIVPKLTTANNTPTSHSGISMEIPEIQIRNVCTTVPIYENNSHEVPYYPESTIEKVLHKQKDTQEIFTGNSESYERMVRQQNGAPEGLPAYQSNIYGTIPYDRMNYKGGFLPYQGLATYSATHRALTASELGILPKPCCQCSCHFPVSDSAHAPAFELKSQRPSVIMVPAKSSQNLDNAFWDTTSKKLESTARRLMTENEKLRRDLQQNGFNKMVDSDSSDEDEDGKQEKYFRVNIDGTTARFKLSREDWERMPINTFPSGGRLLSGDWTRIFLEKVKESNPWCSLRFKNNHVRSQNSRKIHSAVFFRGGAECKRPECNVKVRFVIQKEKGKYVDVTYVGNVCHSSQPDGGDVTNDKKSRQVRRTRMPSSVHD